MSALEKALRYGGFVLAHAAWIASDLNEGELICPIAVVTTGHEREVIPFESESQADSIQMGKASFELLKSSVDCWAFAREGLYSLLDGEAGKRDVLTVSSWVRDLDEPIILQQLFKPKAKGSFHLVGDLMLSIHGQAQSGVVLDKLRAFAMQGMAQHSQGEKWNYWLTYPA